MLALLSLVLTAAPSPPVLEVPSVVELRCEDTAARPCEAAYDVRVVNRSSETFTFYGVEVHSEDGWARKRFEPAQPVVLAPGAAWAKTLHEHVAGTMLLTIDVGTERYRMPNAAQTKLTVRDPGREKAMSDCKACNGDWGRHGMLGIEGCICRTKDGGRVCRDARDCEGECVFDHVEVVRKKSRHCEKGLCVAQPALGRRVGRCSEKVFDFGCVTLLEDGESQQPPQPLPLPFSQVCRD